MKPCVTHKKMYATRELAEEALLGAWIMFEYGPNRGPVAVYQCQDCGHYHLTSSGPMNEKLAQYLKEGKISREKEANYWLDKIKKR